MGLISSTWICRENDSNVCLWPAYLKSTVSREKAIRNHTVLDYTKAWRCPISILYHLRDYDKAKAKLLRLEDSDGMSTPSDSSISEQRLPIVRKPKAKIDTNYNYDFDDDDEFEQSVIEKPPPLRKDITRQNKPENKPNSKNNWDQNNVGSQHFQQAIDVFSSNPHQNFSQENYSIFVDNDKTFANLRNMSPAAQVFPTHKPVVEPVPIDKEPDLPHCDCGSTKIFKLLGRLLRDVQEIKSEIKKINSNAQVQKNTEFQNIEKELNFLSYGALSDFDEKLADMEYFDIMQTTLVLLGGRDLSECIRKLLNAIMGPDLSLKVNWIGANSKGSFQKLKNLLKLIYSTARRNSSCSSATNSEMDHIIKTWLKNAADREGGRNHRRKCNKPPEDDNNNNHQ